MNTAALAAAFAGTTVTALLLAAALAYLRGLPDRAPGITAWAGGFLALALAFGLDLAGVRIGIAEAGIASALLRLLAGALLLGGCQAFLEGRTRPRVLGGIAIAGLVGATGAMGAGLPLTAATLPPALAAAALCTLTAIALLRVQPGQPRSGYRIAGGAMGLLACYALIAGLAGAPVLVPLESAFVGQGAVLAVAIGLAFVVQDAVRMRLRRAERRLQHAIEALDEGFALYGADDRLVMANSAYRHMFPRIAHLLRPGVRYRELLEAAARTGQYLDAAGREAAWIEERQAHHDSGGRSIEQQLADGRWIWLLDRPTPAGEVASLRVDITALKEREQALAESESRYRDLVEGSIQGIIIHDDWRLLFANETAAAMLGYDSVGDLLGCGSLEALLARHEVERLAGYRDARRRGAPAPEHYEADMQRRDGSQVSVDCMIRRVRWGSSVVTQATLVDITERRRAEAAVRAQQDRLEELVAERTAELEAANEELEAFSYSVSHDLRAPLRRVRGFADALDEDCGERLDDDGREYLQRLRRSAGELEGLIDDLLSLSRLSQAEIAAERVDLSALAVEVAESLRAGEPGRDVKLEIEPGLIARGDPRLLRVALDNLLGNAWKYTSREPQPWIAVRSGCHEGVRYFEVADNGVGFDMQYAERLFGPFQRLHGGDEFSGSGIGLATVARIIRRHGGQSWALGAPGRGAAIRFHLGTDSS
jgi:PAS domain S-box-containing protein